MLVTVIAVTVALMHILTGPDYTGPFPLFVNGYLIDVLLPLSTYFLLSIINLRWLKKWYVRAVVVLGFGYTVELVQYLGYDFLGSTYDPLDLLAYSLGVFMAVLLDLYVFPLVFPFWPDPESKTA